MMARETGSPEYLAQAKHIARFLMNHPNMPADKVPYWDFDAPNIPDARVMPLLPLSCFGLDRIEPVG